MLGTIYREKRAVERGAGKRGRKKTGGCNASWRKHEKTIERGTIAVISRGVTGDLLRPRLRNHLQKKERGGP